jgi:dGTP triphosphohydrolase
MNTQKNKITQELKSLFLILNTTKQNQYEQRANIESNKQFQRLEETTQVLTPLQGRQEIVKTRLSHSQEVSTSGMIMISNIAKLLKLNVFDIDYLQALENTCLLHDLGHPPFGHDGADMINDFIVDLGLSEGFDDNNNNLVTLAKNKIGVSEYVQASLIKYPDKLYENQKSYKDLLTKALRADYLHFSKLGIVLENQTRTLICQIMDEADRNSYVCSDLADFFCLGGRISYEQLTKLESYDNLNDNVLSMVRDFCDIVNKGGKSETKQYFNLLKNKFNNSYTITEKGLVELDTDAIAFREFLSDVEFEFFIKPIRTEPLHADNMAMLKDFLDYVVENEYYPSQTYAKLIKEATNYEDRLRYIRDMVSEVSDWYIIKFYQKRNNGEL